MDLQPLPKILQQKDLSTSTRGVSVLYGRKTDGTLIAVEVDNDGKLGSTATFSGSITLGAAKIEDGTTTTKAKVKSDGTDNALVVTQNVQPTPLGSTNSFFSDNTLNAVSNVAWVTLPFGFSSFSITVINSDSTRHLEYSFNGGTNRHGYLKPGEGMTMDFRRQSSISLRVASGVGNITYRLWSY